MTTDPALDLESVRAAIWRLHDNPLGGLWDACFVAAPHVCTYGCGDSVVLVAHGLNDEDGHPGLVVLGAAVL